MTGSDAGTGSGERPQLRLVSSSGPGPVPDDLPRLDPNSDDEPSLGLVLNDAMLQGLVVGDGDDPDNQGDLGDLGDLGHFGGLGDLGDFGDLGDLVELEDGAIELVLGDESDDLEFLLVPLVAEAERQMRSIRRPLDAEMWASELLGMLELGAPANSTAEEREAVTLHLATRLAEHAIAQNSPSGLAILRTLSRIGPAQSRALAAQGATRMAEAGIRDRAWVSVLGRPDVGRSWRFRDPDGDQESVTVVFRYGTRDHTLTALIDHQLGGGVKDCWISENPEAVLAETRQVLESEGIEVEFVSTDQAREALRNAVVHPECPATPDEIEDLAMCRAFLHARVGLLVNGPTDGAGSPPGTLEG
ncbi:MAG TPA: hypothetical protein VLL08_12825 [Kineosporiaceae bacterium]|nr:hypothetical protein [Kineosporiaceae bacterium]